MFDLEEPGVCDLLADYIKRDIDAYCEQAYNDGHRKHLGASILGHECARYLFYTFRWVQTPHASARMSRLFNRGHREEIRYAEWLRGIGFRLISDELKEGEQVRVNDATGHVGGSLDNLAALPERYQIKQDILLCEFKTNGTGTSFANVAEKGVKIAKPQHFDQMSFYGWKRGIKFCLYMIINKNDDDLTVKVVKLDWERAAELERRGTAIIMAKSAPPRISKTPAYHVCKNLCDFNAICWHGKAYEQNCRSCKHATAAPEKQWLCDLYSAQNGPLPEHVIATGCASYEPIV